MKSTQVGASAYLVRWTIYWVDRGDTGLYVFPADEQLRSFYNSRIAPLLRTEYLAKRVESASVVERASARRSAGLVTRKAAS